MALHRTLIATAALLAAVNSITVSPSLSLHHAHSPHLLSHAHSLPRHLRFVHVQQIPQQTQQAQVIATLQYPAVLPTTGINAQYPELGNLAILQHNQGKKLQAAKPQYTSKVQPIVEQYTRKIKPIPVQHSSPVKSIPKTLSSEVHTNPNQYSSIIQPIPRPFASQVQPITIGEHLAEINKRPVVLPALKLANHEAGFRAGNSVRPIVLLHSGKGAGRGNAGQGLVDTKADRPFPLTAIDNEYASIDHLSAPSGRLQHSAPIQSAHSTSSAHKGEKGGGGEGEGEHHSSHGGKKGKGSSSSHHQEYANTGKSGKEAAKKQHEEDGGKEHKQHEEGHGHSDHHHQEGGSSKGGFKAGADRSKGGYVKGYRSKYGKNEFHKSDKFWKDGQERGDFQEYGKKGSTHYGFGAKKKKGGKKQSAKSGGKSGKKGESEGGHDHSDHSGHRGSHGHQESSQHGAEYAKKGGSSSHKEHKTR